MTSPDPTIMPGLVRAWTTPRTDSDRDSDPAQDASLSSVAPDEGPSEWSICFDDETRTDLAQELRIIAWQVHKRDRLHQAGIAYNPAALTAAEITTLQTWAEQQGLVVITVDTWVEKVFYRIAYTRRGLVVCSVNGAFDISRIAIRHNAARGRGRDLTMRGGFTFTLTKRNGLPPVQVKRISAKAAFIRFTSPAGRPPETRNHEDAETKAKVFRGHFVDVGTIGSALLGDARGYRGRRSLAGLAAKLGAPAKLEIDEDTLGGPITEELLDYAMQDVETTWACYTALRDRYASFQLPTPLHRIYSEASIGKAHLAAMGVRGWREVQPDAPNWLIAAIMESYYGGRTECHIRNLPVPGVYTDVRSEYPTVFTLMGMWRYLTATGIDWVDTPVGEVSRWLAELTVEQLLNPATWRELNVLVRIDPDGDLLPTRARFDPGNTPNMALTYRHGTGQWWTLADAAVSALITGRIPAITDALRFTPRAQQTGLKPVEVAGNPAYRIDPSHHDFIARLVELRADLRANPDPNLPGGVEVALKATASSIAYGAPVELNVTDHAKPQLLTLHYPDGTTAAVASNRVETPGRYFHPLVATLVAGSGRLLLGLMQRMVTDLGGTYAMCDTDSMFIVATRTGGLVPCLGGDVRTRDGEDAVHGLRWTQVDEIVSRLVRLNPYQGSVAGQSILKVESDNYEASTGEQVETYALSYAAKRYSLMHLDGEGRPHLTGKPGSRRRSEHGLGHLLAPEQADSDTDWRDALWLYLLSARLGQAAPEPTWFGQPAYGRLAVTSSHEERAFARYNQNRRYRAKVRPFGFGMVTYPTAPEQRRTGMRMLVAPYRRRSGRRQSWIDRSNPASGPWRIRTDNSPYLLDETITVKTMRDVVTEYSQHAETKAAGMDGQPCGRDTVGLLRPRPIHADHLDRVGKEANRAHDDTDMADDGGAPAIYGPKQCRGCGRQVMGKRRWCSDACRKRTGRRQAAGAANGLEPVSNHRAEMAASLIRHPR
jgi:hypothetical protein